MERGVENLQAIDLLTQAAQLRPVLAGDNTKEFFSFAQQVNLDLTAVFLAGLSLHQPHLFAAINQRDNTMVLCLQSLGELADGGPLPFWRSFQVQEQLVLKRGQSIGLAQVFTDPQETAKPIAKQGQLLEIDCVSLG